MEILVKFEVLTAVILKDTVSWDTVLCDQYYWWGTLKVGA